MSKKYELKMTEKEAVEFLITREKNKFEREKKYGKDSSSKHDFKIPQPKIVIKK
jgi:hypothetical protein